MKYFYAGLGIVLLVGVAYASYTHGINKDIIPTANNTVNNTAIINTDLPSTDWPSFGNTTNTTTNTTTDTTTDVGKKSVAITSPKNGAVVTTGDALFSVTGTVSANATKIAMKVYATVTTTCGIEEEGCTETTTENLLDEYTLAKFRPGDTKWSYGVSRAYNNAPGPFATEGRYAATAYFADGTTKTAEVRVTYHYEGGLND